jgi:soluble lytic murein transglycosylase-like protein
MARPTPFAVFAIAAAAIASPLCAPRLAHAQVLEIGDDGAVTTYARPTVFTDDGAEAIAAPVRALPPVRHGGDPATRAAVEREIAAAASAYSLSPALIEAVAWRESRLRHDAVSPVGATGVMQLMPGTARDLGVDRFDLRQNIHGGAAYLSKMVNQFGGDLTLGLAAYNAGPQAVRRWGGVPPYAETRSYVAAILDRLAVRAIQNSPSVATP